VADGSSETMRTPSSWHGGVATLQRHLPSDHSPPYKPRLMDATGGGGAFFVPHGDDRSELVPVPEARGPWSETMLHGRLLAGLAAREVEARTPNGFRVARLTVDMFRFPPMEPVRCSARTPRQGRRVGAVDVSLTCGGVEVARAAALVLRTGPHPVAPDAVPWSPPEWDVPAPEELPAPEGSDQMAGWDIRAITPGGFWSAGQKRVWTRDNWQLVAGEALSPVVRVALAADLPNPLANSGPGGLPFINADLSLYVRRPPLSDWIGLEVAAHLAQDGIAVGSCTLYDRTGAIGWSSVCAVATAQLEGSQAAAAGPVS